MEVPNETQKAIEVAYESMLRNPQNAVFYFYRRRIYETFAVYERKEDNRIFKRIAMASAQYVFPVWQNARPDDVEAKRLLQLMDQFLDGALPLNILRPEAESFWRYIEEFGSTPDAFRIGNAGYAGTSIAEAGLEVCGKIPYEGISLEEGDNDYYVDVWVGDTAFWAASVFAGRFGAADIDPEKNKFFWTWWLKEAIPNAIKEELKNY